MSNCCKSDCCNINIQTLVVCSCSDIKELLKNLKCNCECSCKPAPEQPAPEQPAPEQPAPEQPAPEQPAPEQPAPEQSKPYSLELHHLVGYVEAEDVYINYSEWYGDGTIYGRRNLLTAEGELVRGQGKSKQDLVNSNILVSPDQFGSMNGWLVPVPVENTPAPEQPAPEQPAPEQPAPEQPAPEQPAPEQPAPEQPAPEQPVE